MNEDDPKKNDTGVVLDEEQVRFLIPECCQEGWDTCKHVVVRPKPAKGNIGL